MTTIALIFENVSNPSKINWKKLYFSGLFMFAVVLIFYVWQINDMAKGSFVLNKYESEINVLAQENRSLKVFFEEGSYMDKTVAKINDLNFQKVASVKYVQILGDHSKTAMVNGKKY
jgi:hypothetical protein